MQTLLTDWITSPGSLRNTHTPLIPAHRTVVLSFFDASGLMLPAWAARGYECVCYVHSDNPHEWSDRRNGAVRRVVTPLTRESLEVIADEYDEKVAFAYASPPSTDLSIAGARFWKEKRRLNPKFQDEAAEFIKFIHHIFVEWSCPFVITNPATSILRKLWRESDFVVSPHEFGDYLNKDDRHPLFPKMIPVRDAHVQRTGLWTGGRFRLPLPKPVIPVYKITKSKRGKIRKTSPVLASRAGSLARACAPRGFAKAVCLRLHGER